MMTYRQLRYALEHMDKSFLDDRVCVVNDEHFPNPNVGYIYVDETVIISTGHDHVGTYLLAEFTLDEDNPYNEED